MIRLIRSLLECFGFFAFEKYEILCIDLWIKSLDENHQKIAKTQLALKPLLQRYGQVAALYYKSNLTPSRFLCRATVPAFRVILKSESGKTFTIDTCISDGLLKHIDTGSDKECLLTDLNYVIQSSVALVNVGVPEVDWFDLYDKLGVDFPQQVSEVNRWVILSLPEVRRTYKWGIIYYIFMEKEDVGYLAIQERNSSLFFIDQPESSVTRLEVSLELFCKKN